MTMFSVRGAEVVVDPAVLSEDEPAWPGRTGMAGGVPGLEGGAERCCELRREGLERGIMVIGGEGEMGGDRDGPASSDGMMSGMDMAKSLGNARGGDLSRPR